MITSKRLLRFTAACMCVVGIIGLSGCGSATVELTKYEDAYSSFEYDSNLWEITDNYGADLKTTALTLVYKQDSLLYNVAFLALPPDTLTGEEWLNQIYDTVNAQFGCTNKTLSYTKNDDRTTTTMEFGYNNGEIVTSIRGIAQYNDNGVIIGLATINEENPDKKVLDSIEQMCMSARVDSAPSNEEMLDPEGLFSTFSLILSDETVCQVYGFREGTTAEEAKRVVSTLPGVTSDYWLEDYSGDIGDWMKEYVQAEMDEFAARGYSDIRLEATDMTEDGWSILSQMYYTVPEDLVSDMASVEAEGPVEESTTEDVPLESSDGTTASSESAESEAGEFGESESGEGKSEQAPAEEQVGEPVEEQVGEQTDGKSHTYMCIYKVTRLSDTEILGWKISVDLDGTNGSASNAAIQLMSREGVTINFASDEEPSSQDTSSEPNGASSDASASSDLSAESQE